MKKIKILSFVLVVITTIFMFCGCGTQYIGINRTEKWEKDLNYLKEAYPNKHVNAFFKISEDEFNNKIETLKSNINNLSDEEVENGIYEIVASIGDAHSTAYRNYDYRFPLNFYFFGEDLYLINTSDEYKQALYCKLESVDGMDIREIEEKLRPLTVQANEANIKKSMLGFFCRPDILKGAGIIDDENSATFTFINNQGTAISIEVEAEDNTDGIIMDDPEDESNALYRQHYDLKYWYKYLEDSKILYFKYNECSKYSESGDLKDVIDEVNNYIDNEEIDKIVIDMRDNPGGDEGCLSPLIDKISSSNLNDPDKFYVVVGMRTFSSAILESYYIRQNTNAVFLGEPTSGTPRHYATRKSFELPNSKMIISYSIGFADNIDDYNDSFIPDKTIKVSIGDYINKVDPVMEYIKAK